MRRTWIVAGLMVAAAASASVYQRDIEGQPDSLTRTTYGMLVGTVASAPEFFADAGCCVIVNSLGNNPGSDGQSFSPDDDAKAAFVSDGDSPQLAALHVTRITLIAGPSNGAMVVFRRGPGDTGGGFRYVVMPGYFGLDRAKFVVEFSNGKKVLIRYLMSVVDGRSDVYSDCPVPASLYKSLARALPSRFVRALRFEPRSGRGIPRDLVKQLTPLQKQSASASGAGRWTARFRHT